MRALSGEVLDCRRAAFGSGHNMVNVEDCPLTELCKAAIATSPLVAVVNGLAKRIRNGRQTHDLT